MGYILITERSPLDSSNDRTIRGAVAAAHQKNYVPLLPTLRYPFANPAPALISRVTSATEPYIRFHGPFRDKNIVLSTPCALGIEEIASAH